MGPLSGYRVLELAGIGPGPFACMVLSDLGAEVLRVDRPGGRGLEGLPANVLERGRRSAAVDLKHPEGAEVVLRLAEAADALVEGYRPGVAERLGIGPDAALARNPRLVYGRMTGWGQDGPYAPMAGHDINYIALGGALAHIGRADRPTPPINLVGDFGGGGMLLALGVVCGLLETSRSGQGQVVDASMVDGTALLMSMMFGMRAAGFYSEERESNIIDGGAHFYDVYETADGRYVSIGSIEPQFYAELLRLTGLEGDSDLPAQMDRSAWPAMKERLRAVFKAKTRDEWCQVMDGSNVCFAPVLTMSEAPGHPHNRARETFVEVAGVIQPAPAPRFSRTPGAVQGPAVRPGANTDEALGDWGFAPEDIAKLRSAGAIT
jgi:alpha-methylacyl-CoA racemase